VYRLPKRKQLNQEAIPTTSLADMMFQLLIFFIMTTTLSRVSGFVTDMPAGVSDKQAEQEKHLTVTLTGDEIRLNDEFTTLLSLRNTLKARHLELKQGDDKVVIVSTAGDVAYQSYYQVLAAIQACGGVVAIVSEDAGENK
jgi:biopolymer transport protein ExbD